MLTFDLSKIQLPDHGLMLDLGCGEGRHVFAIMEAFPSIIGEVQFGHSLGNEVQRLPVTFLFKKWRVGASNNN